MKPLLGLFFSLICLFFASSSFALDAKKLKWEEVSRDNGIIIYRADADAASGIVPVRFRTILPYSIARVLAVLDDSERKVEWVPNMQEAKTIHRYSLTDKIEFSRYASPWPFKDRTFLVKAVAKINRPEKEVKINVYSVEDSRKPKNEDYVRAHTHFGDVFVRQLEPKRTAIEMSFLTDFKGNIPVWIINLVQTKWPTNLMQALVGQLKRQDIVIPKEFIKIQNQ